MPTSETVDLNQIATFVKVVETGSFTRAAALLGLPKSGVSRRIADLEHSLGARLLQRTTRKLSLTEAGASYFENVSRALETVADANNCARETQAIPKGVVRLTSAMDFGVRVLPPILGEFSEKYPDIHVELELTQRAVDLVAEGVDVALRFGKLVDSSLVARKLGHFELWLVASNDYIKEFPVKRVADLAKRKCILFRQRTLGSRWTLVGPDGPETVEVSGPLSGDDFLYISELISAGHGIGLVPSIILQEDLKQKKFQRVLPNYHAPGSELHIVYPSKRFLPQRVQLLVEFLASRLSECPPKRKP
ncbi:MAG: LysR family transcriptional regulator [Polyangiaceae bacterium]|nr:LysR family transcriptional regulator [Polyangiaceae bacterium]